MNKEEKEMLKKMKFLSVLLAAVLIIASCQTNTEGSAALDYADRENWAYYAEGEGKAADLFLICPTVDMGRNGNLNMSMGDEDTKASFVGALNMERGIYEESAVMYAPYYRQMTFPVYEYRIAESGEHLEIAYGDVEDAFLHFLSLDDERPFILAGFSQGAQLALMLLEEHFDDPLLQERLVAAYIIGWKVTDGDLEEYPHLKMAEGERDTGVIVSFNTEAEGIDDSMIVPRGVKTYGINPLSWKTDSQVADRSLNLGACFTDYSGNISEEIPYLTGAFIDEERGTLIAVDVDPADYSSSLFPDGVYHLYDYQFFFRNLQENVKIRTEEWRYNHE